MIEDFIKFIGIQRDTTEHKEKIISALGGFISIFIVLFISTYYLGVESSGLIVASMGASAVLLFAVPHGPLSQPWPLIGGHFLSAIIGISCYKMLPIPLIAASVAVGVSIGVMYYTRCIHPPGGATALSAVVSGESVHQLGYSYLFTPVLLNVLSIVLVAIVFNYLFSWRRYPTMLAVHKEPEKIDDKKSGNLGIIPKSDLEFALKSMESFTDISEHELEIIYTTAARHKLGRRLSLENIKLGHYYLHGKNDGSGVIKRVIDESLDDKDMIIYKIITGPERKKTDSTTREAFAIWAKHEVIYVENKWSIK